MSARDAGLDDLRNRPRVVAEPCQPVKCGVPETELAGGPVGTVVGVVTEVAQVGLVKVSSINVTAPLRARARPWTVTLLFTLIEVRPRMFPTKTEPEPSVAELPTCQKTTARAHLTTKTARRDPPPTQQTP